MRQWVVVEVIRLESCDVFESFLNLENALNVCIETLIDLNKMRVAIEAHLAPLYLEVLDSLM